MTDFILNFTVRLFYDNKQVYTKGHVEQIKILNLQIYRFADTYKLLNLSLCVTMFSMKKMVFMIFKDVIQFFCEYGRNACIISSVAVMVCRLFQKLYRICFGENNVKAEQNRYKIVTFFLLIFYIYMVIGITMLSRSESGTREASFQLFRTFSNTFSAKKQIYENIIMFIPYAILLYGLSGVFRKIQICLLVGAASSVLIEVTQWVTRTGCFELDDIMLNTLGMLIGYMICRLFEKVKSLPVLF